MRDDGKTFAVNVDCRLMVAIHDMPAVRTYVGALIEFQIVLDIFAVGTGF